MADATYPSAKLRKLEVSANEAFDTYRELYFEGGVSSVYFWDMEVGFAGVVLMKKGKGTLLFSLYERRKRNKNKTINVLPIATL